MFSFFVPFMLFFYGVLCERDMRKMGGEKTLELTSTASSRLNRVVHVVVHLFCMLARFRFGELEWTQNIQLT